MIKTMVENNLNFSLLTVSAGLTEEQVQIQQVALDFAENEMKPHMAEWDEKVEF